ncbi:MAG TPA: hypothetical protein VGI73_11685 [Solirubrobacterales bacterium]
MLQLRASVPDAHSERFGRLLGDHDGVRRISRQREDGTGAADVFVADVEPAAADPLVAAITEMGIGVDDWALTKLDLVAPLRHPAAASATPASPGSRWSARRGPTRGRWPATWR